MHTSKLQYISLALICIILAMGPSHGSVLSSTSSASGGLPLFSKQFPTVNGHEPDKIVTNGSRLFVTNEASGTIDIYSMQGSYLSSIGSNGSGDGQFYMPYSVTLVGNNLFVSDKGNHRVEEVATNGTYISQFGSAGSGVGQFSYMLDITSDGTHLYVLDTNNMRIQEYDMNGTYVNEFGYGINNLNLTDFSSNDYMTIYDGKIYSPNYIYSTISVFDLNGVYQGSIPVGDPQGHPIDVYGIAIANGLMYISNLDKTILVTDMQGTWEANYTSGGTTTGAFLGTGTMMVYNSQLYVCDTGSLNLGGNIKVFNILSPPDQPMLSQANPGGLSITWHPPAIGSVIPIKGYYVYRAIGNGDYNYVTFTTNSYYNDFAVTAGQTYSYAIASVAENGSVGVSGLSSAVSGSLQVPSTSQVLTTTTTTTTTTVTSTLNQTTKTVTETAIPSEISTSLASKGFFGLPFSMSSFLFALIAIPIIYRKWHNRTP